jgi:WSC domain
LDAKLGTIITQRQVHTPFLQSDIGCTDIPGTIGIIGTPTIDPTTDIAYFFSKTYIPNLRVAGNTGTANGVYYFHGVNINTLEDVFDPILIDGSVAQNDPRRYFVGGVILQRPSLTQIGSVIYGAFGGHCDLFNYTGVVIGIDINKVDIVTHYAMESGPLVTPSDVLLQNGGGGQAGIWMSGMGLASDGQRLFFVTGNGDGHQNNGAPASGSSNLTTLGEAAINMAIDGNGVLSLSDYFQPYDYENMDAADQDFGSGGIVLLDPNTFNGTGVEKMAVTAGKNGKVYILNADNLGGFKLGVGQTDGVLQTIVTNKAVFGASGSYPLEGGYVYLTPVGYPTYCYQLGFSASGVPIFTQVAQTNEVSASRVGVGIPVVTTYQGNAGTAILWMTDPSAGLRAWYAVPGSDGILQTINLPQIGGANKFQRPAFGDGRVYTTDANGILYALGAPVALPLNCTSPLDFGPLPYGSAQTLSITCVANIAITSLNGMTVEDDRFVVTNSSLPAGLLAAGASFTFPVTWNLTNAILLNNPNGSYGSSTPGIKSTPLTIYTTNAVSGYTTLFPISLMGTEVSAAPFLEVAPVTVDYGGVVITDSTNISTISSPFTISNVGQGSMTILGYAYTYNYQGSNSIFTNATQTNGVWNLGLGFTSLSLPPINSVINGNSALSIQSTFDPIDGVGSYTSFFQIWTTGGSVNIVLEGSASPPPIANFSISDGQGGWLYNDLSMDFGDVAPGSSSSRQIRICNRGGSVLEIDKSKPPNGVFHISDPTELEETQQIPVNTCAYGTVLMVANTEEYNVPNVFLNNTWTLNTNDLTFGVHVVYITGTVVSTKVGPINSAGQPVYNYLGCFHEAYSGPRLFPNEPLSPNANMSNNNCQDACFASEQYAFAGTEFGDECWCGNTPPPLANQDTLDIYCNFACPGDGNDRCGAANYLSVFYDPTKYVAGTNPALYGPQTIQIVGNYVYIGCYCEATTGRALTGNTPQAPANGFTIELCEAACQGYTYFGMEYSNQCFCGNTINAGSVNQSSSSPSTNGCSMLCTGNQNEYCGGKYLLLLSHIF